MSKQYLTMSLSECGRYDKQHNLKAKLTGWGKICAERAAKGLRKRKRVKKGVK